MGDKRDLIIEAFKKYLPERVVEKIISNPEQVRVEGERRFVTILFGDVSGFTALSEKLDPEEVVHIINRYFATMLKIVEKYGGDVDKFVGDALMVIFGAPIAHSDDPERAVRAAIEMQKAIQAFDPVVTPDGTVVKVKMSIGINTGEIVAVNMGSDKRMEYTVMGDNVNLSARLEGVATADQIIISDTTYQYIKDVIDCEKLKPVKVKGKTKPIQIYLVKDVKEDNRAYAIPFVGREKELGFIESFINEKGSSLIITGKEGTGKTRLVDEFIEKSAIKEIDIVGIKSYPFFKNTPYDTIIRLLYDLLKLSPDAPIGIKEEKLSFLEKDMADIIAHLFGIKQIEGVSPKELHSIIEEYITTFILNNFKGKKTVLHIEDIDYTDDDSLAIIKNIVNEHRENIYILAESEEFIPWFEKELPLNPFDRESIEKISVSILGTEKIDKKIIDFIVSKSEGNALFAISILSTLVKKKMIRRRKGACYFSAKFSPNMISDTMKGVMLGVLDSLPEEEKMVLQYASVMGDLFYKTILKELKIIKDVSKIDMILASLTDKSIISFEGEDKYSFNSSIMREVSYNSLLKKRRKTLHLKIAESIENLFKDRLPDFYQSLFYHYYEAKQIEKSVEYAYLAGMQAVDLFSNNTALYYLKKALDLYDSINDKEKVYVVALKIGSVYDIIGERDFAYKYLRKSLFIANKMKDITRIVNVLLSMGAFFDKTGKPDKGISYFKRALTISRKNNYKKGIAGAYNNLGIINQRNGAMEDAIKYFHKALDINLSLEEYKDAAKQYFNMGNISTNMGKHEDALYYYEKALSINVKIDDKVAIAKTYNAMGTIFDIMGDFNSALDYYQKSMEISDEIGYKEGKALVLFNMSIVYAKQGDNGTAFSMLEESAQIRENMGDLNGLSEVFLNMGEIKQRTGKFIEAIDYYDKVVNIQEKIKDRFLLLYAYIKLESVYVFIGQIDKYYSLQESIKDMLKKIRIPEFIITHKINIIALDLLINNKESIKVNISDIEQKSMEIGNPDIISIMLFYKLFAATLENDIKELKKIKNEIDSLLDMMQDPFLYWINAYADFLISVNKEKSEQLLSSLDMFENDFYRALSYIEITNRGIGNYAEKAFNISDDNKYVSFIIKAAYILAEQNKQTGDIESAIQYILKSVAAYKKVYDLLKEEHRKYFSDFYKDIFVFAVQLNALKGKEFVLNFVSEWKEYIDDKTLNQLCVDYNYLKSVIC